MTLERKRIVSEKAYRRVIEEAKLMGSATHVGEQREREGLGLHPLVDPSEYGVIRRSLQRFRQDGDVWTLPNGTPMAETTLLDTTGSMGGNVGIALVVLETAYKLLTEGPHAVLARYDVQVMHEIFGDVTDKYILKRSQFEMDVEIAKQLTYMSPERAGGDTPEDPQYGLFGDAYLTSAFINQYGLKYYHFTVSDAPGRYYVDTANLTRVFGPTVFERLAENGQQIDRGHLQLNQILADLRKNAHTFFFQVNNDSEATRFWGKLYGECMLKLPRTELLGHMKAVVIGLTEGTLDLQSVEEFLRNAQIGRDDARAILRAVADIPVGAQKTLPNFDKIPLAGSVFTNKGDLWPIDKNMVPSKIEEKKDAKKPPKKGKVWL